MRPSKKVRIHHDSEDYHKATTLAQWLFVKYDMSYKTFRNKSKARRDKMRQEFEADTGVDLTAQEQARNRKREYWDQDDKLDMDLRGIMAYAKAQGKRVIDLSDEEKARFIRDKK